MFEHLFKKFGLLLLFILAICPAARATVVVLMGTQEEILVAADSFFLTNGVEALQEMPCKIHQEGKVFFALEGQIGSSNSDFIKIARSAIANAKSQQDAINLAAVPLSHELAAGLAYAAKKDPA